MLELYKSMQRLYWKIPACLQDTTKLKISPAIASRQVKETQTKKGEKGQANHA